MIVDTSAVLAILFAEPEAEAFTAAVLADPSPRMSVASFLEAALRVDGLKVPGLGDRLDDLLRALGITLEPVTLDQAHAARAAGARFGKGRHPAGLNFGDCFSYALATTVDEPLLFKGDDFARTDLARAL